MPYKDPEKAKERARKNAKKRFLRAEAQGPEALAAYRKKAAERQREWRSKNRDKVNARKRKIRADNPERAREKSHQWPSFKYGDAAYEKDIRRKYRLTLFEYNQLMTQQDESCAICKLPADQHKKGRLHVDHDHKTSKVRGLLCHNCNAGIGYLRDDTHVMAQAINYLLKTAVNGG